MMATRLRGPTFDPIEFRTREIRTSKLVNSRGGKYRLSISHPVISKTISDLEQTLGVRLLDRNVHGVEPTAYGRALLKCGVAVFDEMRQRLTGLETSQSSRVP